MLKASKIKKDNIMLVTQSEIPIMYSKMASRALCNSGVRVYYVIHGSLTICSEENYCSIWYTESISGAVGLSK